MKVIVIGCYYSAQLDPFFESNYFKGKQNISNLLYERKLLAGLNAVVTPGDLAVFSVPHVGIYPVESKKASVAHSPIEEYVRAIDYNAFAPIKHHSQRRALEKALRAYEKTLPAEECGTVLICEAYLPYLAAADAVFGDDPRFKTIVIVPDAPRSMDNSGLVRKLLKGGYLRQTDKLLCKADGFVLFSDQMKRLPWAEGKPTIVSEGIVEPVEPTEFQKKKIVFAGKLDDINAVAELIASMAYIDDPEVSLWIYGNGNLALSSTDPRIHLCGFLSPEALKREFASAQVQVCLRKTSIKASESFPSKLFTALSYRCAVVANRFAPFNRTLEDALFITETTDPKDIAEAIERALSAKPESFDWKALLKEYSASALVANVLSMVSR